MTRQEKIKFIRNYKHKDSELDYSQMTDQELDKIIEVLDRLGIHDGASLEKLISLGITKEEEKFFTELFEKY